MNNNISLLVESFFDNEVEQEYELDNKGLIQNLFHVGDILYSSDEGELLLLRREIGENVARILGVGGILYTIIAYCYNNEGSFDFFNLFPLDIKLSKQKDKIPAMQSDYTYDLGKAEAEMYREEFGERWMLPNAVDCVTLKPLWKDISRVIGETYVHSTRDYIPIRMWSSFDMLNDDKTYVYSLPAGSFIANLKNGTRQFTHNVYPVLTMDNNIIKKVKFV